MKKLVFITLCIIFSVYTYAQNYNPEIYDQRGQYLTEVPTSQEIGSTQINLNYINGSLYPRITTSGYSLFGSGLGVMGLGEISRIYKQGFAEKGYNIYADISMLVSAGAVYDFSHNSQNQIAYLGLGYYSGKAFWGPIGGVFVNSKEWDFMFLGQYAIQSAHIKYADGDIDLNSWYRLHLKRNISRSFSFGAYSERFFLSGLVAEYKFFGKEGSSISGYLGQELGSGNLTLGFGIKFYTLDKRNGIRY